MPIIYILRLEQNKYYIGKTKNYIERIDQHLSGVGSEWTKKYKPLQVVDTINQTMHFTELAITIRYMKEYGIENVRGATYCSVYLTRDEKKDIQKHIRAEYDLCLICGDNKHFAKQCTSKQTFFQRFRKWICCLKKTHYNLVEDNDNIIEFGKYKGTSFEEVRNRDPEYCNWIVKTQSNSPNFNRFKLWLNYQ